MKPAFTGGSLSFKGDKKKAKKKKKNTKHGLSSKERIEETQEKTPQINADEDLTEAEKAALEKKRERERKELEKIAGKSHRERIEEYNQRLSELTEHNDIPRVSFVRVVVTWCSWKAVLIYFIRPCLLQVSAAGNG